MPHPDLHRTVPFVTRLVAVTCALVAAGSVQRGRADLPPLLPRAVLFANPAREAPALSPDGTLLGYLAPSRAGVLNVWVQPAAAASAGDTNAVQAPARMVTHEARRDIVGYWWAGDGQHVLYLKDAGGDENTHLYSQAIASADSAAARDLTPYPGVRVEGVYVDPRQPSVVLAGLNVRDRQVFDIHRIDLTTGRVALDTQNPGDVIAWTPDAAFTIRAATALDSASNTIVRVRDSADAPWRTIARWSFEDAGSDRAQKVIGFTEDGAALYMQVPVGANTSRLALIDAHDGHELKTLAADPRADLWNVYDFGTGSNLVAALIHPRTGAVQAVGVEYLLPEWKVLDPSIRDDLDRLAHLHAGVPIVVSRTLADDRWIVGYVNDVSPAAYYLYERPAGRATLLFETRPDLAGVAWAPMTPFTIRARDGLTIPAYLTTPVGVPAEHLPMVVLVHGGPWFRDSWGFDPEVQWLANRGYAVLQIEFRASSGFGREFLNAGDHEFGAGAVLKDIADGVQWTVRKGIADPARIAISGGSFGGYATLCGLAFTPELYACGVDLVGPSDLKRLIESFPPYWAPRRRRWLNRFGDVVASDSLNERLSPLYHVDSIRAPLFVAHGKNDPRVAMENSDRIVAALRKRGVPVTYVVYKDEGHGLERAENNQDYFGRMEEFLARYLGGRAEPWAKVKGAAVDVR